MDEPFGAVDPIVRADLQQELIRLQRELDKTVVFVTHDIDEAFLLGDQVIILEKGAVDRAGRQPQRDSRESGQRVRGQLHRASNAASAPCTSSDGVLVDADGRAAGVLVDDVPAQGGAKAT